LFDIVVIAVCAAVCGQTAWTEMAFYGQDHAHWLQTFLRLPNGIPSHDTFRYVLTRLDPTAFQRAFAGWLTALRLPADLDHLAIDGKALRGSADRAHGAGPLHLVSVWATQNRLTLAQVAVTDKSNEITAIPRLLEILDVRGAVVTLDAMGCQKEIAATIRGAKADYVLAVKDNQPRLLEDVQQAVADYLDRAGPDDERSWVETVETGHGRHDVRRYILLTDVTGIRDRALWADLRCLCLVVRERTVRGETTCEASYYIGSWSGSVGDYARVIRDHWGIENGCHWVLDVTYREDQQRQRRDHGAENLAWLRRFAVSLLRNDTTCDRSVRAKSVKALADHNFLLRVLAQGAGEKEDA
jgi:predicted transposase YbfD/YdcC